MAKDTFRKRFTFWLDLFKDDEFKLAEEIEVLKKKRNFSRYIRDGLRLILDLRAGKTDVLVELFPWVADTFAQVEPIPQKDSYQALQKQLARLEQHLIREGATPIPRTSSPIKISDEPVDSSGIEIKKAKNSDSNSAQNFLESMSMFG